MFIHEYPYTSFSEYNLTWLIKTVRDLQASMSDYEALHSITFGGDWDITKSYQAWTIVSDPNTHDGYLSLGPVPNNVPLTDTTYWLKIADYTTGLANVNTRVDNVENYITNTIDPDISTLQNDVNNIDTVEIPAIQNDITLIQGDITNLAKQIVKGPRKIIIFGDSYVMDNPPSGETSFRTYMDSLVALVPNIEYELKSDGGEGFGQTGIYSFLYDVQNYVTSFDPDEVTDVFFVGGYNDRSHSTSDIYTGMSDSFAEVRTKYPNAKISVGHFGWSATLSSTDRDAIVGYSLLAWRNCKRYGASYMTNAEYTMHNYDLFYISDNFHPNGNGELEIAKQVLNYILTGTCDVHYGYKNLKFNQGDIVGNNTSSAYDCGFKLDNDIVTFYPPDGEIIFTTDYNMSVTTYTQTLQFTTNSQGYRGYAIGMYDSAKTVAERIQMAGYLQNNTEFRDLAPCNVIMSGGFLHIRPYGINSDRDGFETYGNIHAIHPIGGAVSIPTLSC